MKKWIPWLCFLLVLALPDLFAGKKAVIVSVTISGPDEHTLVIPPDYPEYTLDYSCDGKYRLVPEEEEEEEENPEYEEKYLWSAGGCEIVGSSDAPTVSVKFREQDVENASVTCIYSVICKSGSGEGCSQSASKTIYMPVWDTYHDIGMYVKGETISPGARKAVAVGGSLACSVTPSSTWEYDRRQSTSITTPLDAIVSSGSPYWQCSSGSFQSSVIGTSVTWLAPETPAQGVSLKVFFDDVPYPKPENEAGTTDDAAAEAGEVIVDVVKIDRLECEEVTSKTNDPGDNETVYLPVGFNEGAVTVNAIPDPTVGWPYGKPAWSGDIQSSSGGTATVDTTTPGFKTVAAECGNTIKIKICVLKVEKIQYKLFNMNSYADFSGTLKVVKYEPVKFRAVTIPPADSLPAASILWGGSFGTSGTGAVVVHSQDSSYASSDADILKVTVKCGNMKEESVLVCRYVMGAHSNQSTIVNGAYSFDGHAWVSITDFSSSSSSPIGNSYGLFAITTDYDGDGNPDTMQVDAPGYTNSAPYNRYYVISPSQFSNFLTFTRTYHAYTYLYNCSSWASDLVNNT